MSQAGQRLALLAVGEVGRTADLSAFPPLRTALTQALSSASEEVKGAASLALGAVCIGNLAAYLPFLLQAIQDQVAAPHSARSNRPRHFKCFVWPPLFRAFSPCRISCSAQFTCTESCTSHDYK